MQYKIEDHFGAVKELTVLANELNGSIVDLDILIMASAQF